MKRLLVYVDSRLVIHVAAGDKLSRSNFPVMIYGNKNIPLSWRYNFYSITNACIHIIKKIDILIYSLQSTITF